MNGPIRPYYSTLIQMVIKLTKRTENHIKNKIESPLQIITPNNEINPAALLAHKYVRTY